eukprot:5732637-Prymnesium_polylepis.2
MPAAVRYCSARWLGVDMTNSISNGNGREEHTGRLRVGVAGGGALTLTTVAARVSSPATESGSASMCASTTTTPAGIRGRDLM